MKQYFKPFLIFLVIATSLTACRDSDRDKDVVRRSSTDFALGTQAILDMLRTTHAFSERDTVVSHPADTLAQMGCIDTIYYSNASFVVPTTAVLDFGTNTENTCSDGSTRWGSIAVDYSDLYASVGAVTTITSQGYHVNGFRIVGTLTVTNISVSPTVCSLNLSDVTVSNDTMNVRLSGTYTMHWQAGRETTTPVDDEFALFGALSGVNSRGANFGVEVEEDNKVVVNFGCEWPGSGQAKITPTALAPRTLDFGSGCDNIYWVVVTSDTQEFTLVE